MSMNRKLRVLPAAGRRGRNWRLRGTSTRHPQWAKAVNQISWLYRENSETVRRLSTTAHSQAYLLQETIDWGATTASNEWRASGTPVNYRTLHF